MNNQYRVVCLGIHDTFLLRFIKGSKLSMNSAVSIKTNIVASGFCGNISVICGPRGGNGFN